MKPFRYQQATDAAGAVAAVAASPSAAYLAGGTNLVDLMKLGVAAPDLLVDISHLHLSEIEPLPGGDCGSAPRCATVNSPLMRTYATIFPS